MKKKFLSFKMPKGYSKVLHAVIIALNLAGILMIVSANMTIKADESFLLKVFIKEMMFVIISYYSMAFLARNFTFSKFVKYLKILLILMFVSLISTRAFSARGGAQAWIRLGRITIQPSEFAKVLVVLLMAYYLGDREKDSKNKTVWEIINKPFMIVMFIFMIVLFWQSDLGSAVVIFGIAYLLMLIPANYKLKSMQKYMFVFLLLGLVFVFLLTTPFGIKIVEMLPLQEYMINRFKISANPFAYRYDEGYQIFNGIVAFAKGGWFGVGYGNGFIKYSYLPESHNDAILAVIVEELGIVGFMIIIALFAVMIYELIKATFKTNKERDKMLLMGTVFYFMIHFVFNVGGITALIPLTGVPLLLLSAGGTSRLAFMMIIGLSQNRIAMLSHQKKDRGS